MDIKTTIILVLLGAAITYLIYDSMCLKAELKKQFSDLTTQVDDSNTKLLPEIKNELDRVVNRVKAVNTETIIQVRKMNSLQNQHINDTNINDLMTSSESSDNNFVSDAAKHIKVNENEPYLSNDTPCEGGCGFPDTCVDIPIKSMLNNINTQSTVIDVSNNDVSNNIAPNIKESKESKESKELKQTNNANTKVINESKDTNDNIDQIDNISNYTMNDLKQIAKKHNVPLVNKIDNKRKQLNKTELFDVLKKYLVSKK